MLVETEKMLCFVLFLWSVTPGVIKAYVIIIVVIIVIIIIIVVITIIIIIIIGIKINNG